MKPLFCGLLLLPLLPAHGQLSTTTLLRGQLKRAQHDTVKIRLYTELAQAYTIRSIPSDSAYSMAVKGLSLARKHQLPLEESKLLVALGYYYKRLSQYAQAQSAYLRALRLIEKKDPSRLQYQIVYYLASIYGDQGMFQKAIEAASTCLQMAEQLNDSVYMAQAYQLLALGHRDVRNMPAAISYATRSYLLSRQLTHHYPGRESLVMTAEEILAEMYEAQGHAAQAYPYLKKYLAHVIATNDVIQVSEAATNVGKNLVQQKRPREAIRHLDESVHKKLISPDISYTHEIYALAYQQLGQAKKAMFHAEKAYRHALKEGNLKEIKAVLQLLVTLEESQKIYPRAMTHLRQLTAINDSLFTHQKSQAIAEVEAKYRVSQQEQTIESLRKDAVLRQIKLDKRSRELDVQRQQQALLAMFTLLLLISIVSLWFIFRHPEFRTTYRPAYSYGRQRLSGAGQPAPVVHAPAPKPADSPLPR